MPRGLYPHLKDPHSLPGKLRALRRDDSHYTTCSARTVTAAIHRDPVLRERDWAIETYVAFPKRSPREEPPQAHLLVRVVNLGVKR